MFFANALVISATLAVGALAALPAAGRYYIVNPDTGRRFDVEGLESGPQTPIIGFPPNDGDNQKWDITQEATQGDSGFYKFTSVFPHQHAYVNAQNEGNGLTSEVFSTTFNVTEFGTDNGFIISIPLTNPLLVVTTTANAAQLTLHVRDETDNLQVWEFQLVE